MPQEETISEETGASDSIMSTKFNSVELLMKLETDQNYVNTIVCPFPDPVDPNYPNNCNQISYPCSYLKVSHKDIIEHFQESVEPWWGSIKSLWLSEKCKHAEQMKRRNFICSQPYHRQVSCKICTAHTMLDIHHWYSTMAYITECKPYYHANDTSYMYQCH